MFLLVLSCFVTLYFLEMSSSIAARSLLGPRPRNRYLATRRPFSLYRVGGLDQMHSKKCCQLFILGSKSSLEEGAMMTTYLGNYFYFETIKYIQIPSDSHSQPCLDHLCLAGRHAGQISKTHLKCLRRWDSSTAWWKVLHACLTSYSILQYSLWVHERCRSKWIAWLGACSRWLAVCVEASSLLQDEPH